MSILIKGMEMPKTCIECMFSEHGSINEFEYWCALTGSWLGAWGDKQMWEYMRAADCPLIEVPTPHGSLIDVGALMLEFAEFVRASNNSDFAAVPTWNDAVSLLGSAPTIIEAEEGEE